MREHLSSRSAGRFLIRGLVSPQVSPSVRSLATLDIPGKTTQEVDALLTPKRDRKRSFIYDPKLFKQDGRKAPLSKETPHGSLAPQPSAPVSVTAEAKSTSEKSKIKNEEISSDLVGKWRKTRPNPVWEEWKRGTEADPFAEMLRSPMRKCALTQAKLPKDFLIGFRSVPSSSPETDFPSFSTPLFSDGSTSLASTVEASKPTSIGDSFPTNSRTKTKQYIIPSRVVHPRFEVRRGGKGKYVLCRRETVADLLAGKGKAVGRLFPNTTLAHPDLLSEIDHQLVHRVLQEAELFALRQKSYLSRQMSSSTSSTSLPNFDTEAEGNIVTCTNTTSSSVVRNISDQEWQNLKNQAKKIHSESVDDLTQMQALVLSSAADTTDMTPSDPHEPSHISLQVRASDIEQSREPLNDGSTPSRRRYIPVYDLNRLIPDKDQRNVLINHLSHLVSLSTTQPNAASRSIFLLFSKSTDSTEPSILPLLIALWRLRMWSDPEVWTGDHQPSSEWKQSGLECVRGFNTVREGAMDTYLEWN